MAEGRADAVKCAATRNADPAEPTFEDVVRMFSHLEPPASAYRRAEAADVQLGGRVSSVSSIPPYKVPNEKEVEALFQKLAPKSRPDSKLLNVAEAFYTHFNHAQNAINSFEQALPAMARSFATRYKTAVVGRTSNGDLVRITYWFDNFRFTPPYMMSDSSEILPPTPMAAIRTGQTYACGMEGDFKATLELIETTEERHAKTKAAVIEFVNAHKSAVGSLPVQRKGSVAEPKSIHIKNAFRTTIPIVVGSRWCKSRLLAQTPLEAWLIGEDPYDIGGYVIIDGQAKTVGGVYSHTPNFGMFVHTQYKTEEVRVDLMVRRDPFYGDTYHLLPSMVKPIKKAKDRKGYSLVIPDLTIEIPWNQPDMNAKESGSVKLHLSRIPIKALFHYYGARSDQEIQNYIFPGVPFSDRRVKILSDALTKGSYHEAYREAAYPYSPEEALLFIANTILSQTTKDIYTREVAKDLQDMSSELKLSPELKADATAFLVASKLRERARQILEETFFFNINRDPRKVCQAMGSIVAQIINIHLGIEPQTDRNAMYNLRVQAIGEQLVIEAKTIFRKEVIVNITDRIENTLLKKKDWAEIVASFEKEIKAQVEASGPKFGKKIKQAYKSTSKTEGKQPRLLGEVYDPKSIYFLFSKFNEDLIRPALGEKDATVVFERRRAHPSQILLKCSVQTSDSGADVGRYHQPAIYTFLSMCQSERAVREVLGMKDTNHPSPTAAASASLESFLG